MALSNLRVPNQTSLYVNSVESNFISGCNGAITLPNGFKVTCIQNNSMVYVTVYFSLANQTLTSSNVITLNQAVPIPPIGAAQFAPILYLDNGTWLIGQATINSLGFISLTTLQQGTFTSGHTFNVASFTFIYSLY